MSSPSAVGGPEAVRGVGREGPAGDELVQHRPGVRVEIARGGAVARVVEDLRELAAHLPGVEEEGPVDERHDLGERDPAELAPTRELGDGDVLGPPLDGGAARAGLGEGPQRALPPRRVLLAQRLLVLPHLRQELVAPAGVEQPRHHADGPRGVEDVRDARRVRGRDLHRGVLAAGGRPADQQRDPHAAALHLGGHRDHLVERGRDQPRQPDDVGALGVGRLEDPVGRHHDAQVDHPVVVAAEHHADDVLADVVDVALHGGHHDGPLGLGVLAGGLRAGALLLHVGLEVRHRPLHDARALDDLGQEHLPRAEQVADHVHPGHQGPLDDGQRRAVADAGLLGVGLDVVDDAVHQRVLQALLDGPGPPGLVDHARAAVLAHPLGQLHEPVGGVGAAVEEDVLDGLQQLLVDLLVDGELAGVDDAHVHPGADGVEEERRVHRLAHDLVPPEREGQVADAAAHLRARAGLLDPPGGLDEGHGVAVVLLDAGGDGEDVRVEDDVARRHAGLLDQQPVGALADRDLALDRVGLALLVEGHHDHRGAEAARLAGAVQELLLALLEADRVHDRLALHAAQAGLDHRPLGAVDHDRHARDLGLGRDHVEERGHGGLGVEHGLVHVHVDDVRAAAHLLGRDLERRREVVGEDQVGEAARPGHVGALADHR